MKRFKSRKVATISIATAMVFAIAGIAFAYFTSQGTGVGSAQTGRATNLTVSQIGAGYDSLLASGGYSQDQCFTCAGVSELGNAVTLSTHDATQLVTAVVAVDNWGGAVSGVPMTLSVPSGTVSGAFQDTQDFSFPPAVGQTRR